MRPEHLVRDTQVAGVTSPNLCDAASFAERHDGHVPGLGDGQEARGGRHVPTVRQAEQGGRPVPHRCPPSPPDRSVILISY